MIVNKIKLNLKDLENGDGYIKIPVNMDFDTLDQHEVLKTDFIDIEVEKAIKLLAEKVDAQVKSEDALRFTQAALNLAHVLATLNNMKN